VNTALSQPVAKRLIDGAPVRRHPDLFDPAHRYRQASSMGDLPLRTRTDRGRFVSCALVR